MSSSALRIGSIDYVLRNANGYEKHGTFSADNAGSSWRRTLTGIPVAADYAIELHAVDGEKGRECRSVSARFDVMRTQTVMVLVNLSCEGSSQRGSVIVD